MGYHHTLALVIELLCVYGREAITLTWSVNCSLPLGTVQWAVNTQQACLLLERAPHQAHNKHVADAFGTKN